MSTKISAFEVGHLTGASADEPMEPFEMSMRHDDFIVGYIVGYSEMESFRAASPRVAAISAGALAHRYNIPLKTLLPHLGFDAELLEELRQAHADALENSAEDLEEDDE